MQTDLENRFQKLVQKDKNIHNAYLLIHSEKHNIHLNVARGLTNNTPAHPNQPYFIASVDKMFISVLISMLYEQGKLSFEDPISTYLDPELLNNLHIYKGQDYTKDIKIKHLLNHTSGLFGDAVEKQGTSLLDLLLDEPSETWTSTYIIEWSKENLKTHFPPGEGFFYSDIGYYLLILIIEEVVKKPFHEVLIEYIFQPLKMNHTSMLQFTEPLENNEYPVADCYIKDKNITQNVKLGMDYAGGRVISTSEDLLLFMKAFVNGNLLDRKTMEQMEDWAKYFIGIDYGYGIMKFKHVPLFMPKKYSSWGQAGSNGTFMFYHPELETYIIGSLNSFPYNRKGIMFMFKMIDSLYKISKNKS